MLKKQGSTVFFKNPPAIKGYAAVVGKKEANGPLKEEFDVIFTDVFAGEKTYEKAEAKLQSTAVSRAISKSKLEKEKIEYVLGGDLLNQCISSSYGLRDFGIPFIGLYGACSTMSESLGLASLLCASGAAQFCSAVSSSHFCSAERQFRFPLNYGGQRTPTAQWTVTGAGSVVVSKEAEKDDVKIRSVTFGKIEDLGITDINNMGAAMAPDDVKIRPYPKLEGMVFFYTQIQYLRGVKALFKNFLMQKIVEKTVNKIRLLSSIH